MEEKGRMKLDVSIGILYTATMALAILFIGLMKTYNAEVYGYLFGNVLAVTSEELLHDCRIEFRRHRCDCALLERTVLHRIRPRNGGSFWSAGPAHIFPLADPSRAHGGDIPQDRRRDPCLCDDPDSCLHRLPTDT